MSWYMASSFIYSPFIYEDRTLIFLVESETVDKEFLRRVHTSLILLGSVVE